MFPCLLFFTRVDFPRHLAVRFFLPRTPHAFLITASSLYFLGHLEQGNNWRQIFKLTFTAAALDFIWKAELPAARHLILKTRYFSKIGPRGISHAVLFPAAGRCLFFAFPSCIMTLQRSADTGALVTAPLASSGKIFRLRAFPVSTPLAPVTVNVVNPLFGFQILKKGVQHAPSKAKRIFGLS